KVESLEADLKKTKQVYGAAYTKLIMKVNKLEKAVKTRHSRRRAKIVVSDDEEDSEDSSKQGRIIEEIDEDAGVTLLKQMFTLILEDEGQLVLVVVELILLKNQLVLLVHQCQLVLLQEQERLGHDTAVRLQEELDEEERQRMARVHEAAQSFTEEEWENIRARVEVDEELSRRLQEEERNKYTEVKRNKPMTQAQQRNYMINYIKHMGGHTLQQLKRYSFDKLKELFETTMKNVNTFVPVETEDRGRASELAFGSSQATIIDSAEVGSSKRAAEVELDHEDMLKVFDRDDLVMLWNLVKERFNSTEPIDDKERTLWVELKSVPDQMEFHGLFSPPTLDLSYSGLEEFQQPKFEGYGPKSSKSVSEDISNEVRKSPDASLVEELVSNDKLEKKTLFLTGHPQKEDQGYVDSGCSRHMTGNMSYLSDFKEFDGGYDTFGGGSKGGGITNFKSHLNNYAGASLDRKSTTGSCQFLGRRLISWQWGGGGKKQIHSLPHTLTSKGRVVPAASCCGNK
ncbi:hypothetical protein Tco_0899393, partial [Tanacetum coccineum]